MASPADNVKPSSSQTKVHPSHSLLRDVVDGLRGLHNIDSHAALFDNELFVLADDDEREVPRIVNVAWKQVYVGVGLAGQEGP